MDSEGVQYNAAIIVKLKKLYNNIRKQYDLNLVRAFLMIDKYGRSKESSKGTDRSKQAEKPAPSSPRAAVSQPVQQPVQAQTVIVQDNSKLDAVLANSKRASLNIIDRVFRRNFTKQIRKWQYNAHPERKLEYIHN
jgi:hypothetical protein